MIKLDYDEKKQKAIISGDRFSEIREHFSVENAAAKFNRSFYIPKRLYAIAPNGIFDIGLFSEIKKFLNEKQYNVEFDLSESFLEKINPKLDKPLIKRLALSLRDYQENTVIRCMEEGRGVALLGTGAGKTLTIATLIENFYLYSKDVKNFKCLIIVPDLSLVNQTYKDFLEYNVSYTHTRWTGSLTPDLNANVIIANIDIIRSKYDQNKWIQDVDLLIVDEAHKMGKGNKSSKILDKIKTPNKFGFTGTLPEDNIEKWNILGKLGDVLISKNSFELREEKYLASVHVKMLNLLYKDVPKPIINTGHTTDDYHNELIFISNNSFRNKVIQTTCNNFNNNILILINNISHGQHLFDLFTKNLINKKVYFIRGEVEVEERDKVKAIMESSNDVICIAVSAIFSTGVNIKNIHMIIFAAGGKSFIRTVQSIGRGLRLNENKDGLTIIDICDMLNYGSEHAQKRKEIYNKEKITFSQHLIKE
jgi:superfamily II DNA or RNA helicase